jgi:hypothetical protein
MILNQSSLEMLLAKVEAKDVEARELSAIEYKQMQ